ncbi:tyrosine-type recombinase/integrase [Beduini massiliensis]|uniref:tyrosine-type recombinase/integrase n=1 Tax=Beduini massiliensis TaxID=1585974 RepID=UPI00059A91D6|nr:tyrosine-type recombinase/integrase [Beduini massiliensis]
MKRAKLSVKTIKKYKNFLYEEERSTSTINKYIRDIQSFYEYLPEDKMITKEILVAYKQHLADKKYKISSINSMLVAINGLLEFMNLSSFKLKLHKLQRNVICEEELSKEEYKRLLEAALKKENERLYMLLQTICGTGIRVSEHQYITVESLKEGKSVVHNKGKTRVIFIPDKLRKILILYCKQEKILSGPIFVTKRGNPMDRSNIWVAMKKLCEDAKVDGKKVYPHNLRHLFALTYYRMQKDVVRLADILGHSNIETTRIYTMTSGKEYQKSLSKMDLVDLLC